MSRRNRMFGAAVLVAAAYTMGCAGSEAQETAESAPRPVRVAPVERDTVARPVTAAGTVAPGDEAELSFKVGGVVARIAVDAGDRVRKGQTLAVLHLAEIDAAVARARSAAEKAERDLARARRLYADSVVSRVQLDDAGTAAEVARADLEAAEFNRRYAVITAPADGVVLRRTAEPGETVAPGAPILAVGSRARGNVARLLLPDRDVMALRLGDSATARFGALPDREFAGRVSQIAAAADPATGAYPVEVTLDDGGALAAGMVGEVTVLPRRGAPATLVPIEAVLEADGRAATVYALSADRRRAEPRQVSVGFISGDRVVVGGLENVGEVVVEGAAYLDGAEAVEVRP